MKKIQIYLATRINNNLAKNELILSEVILICYNFVLSSAEPTVNLSSLPEPGSDEHREIWQQRLREVRTCLVDEYKNTFCPSYRTPVHSICQMS